MFLFESRLGLFLISAVLGLLGFGFNLISLTSPAFSAAEKDDLIARFRLKGQEVAALEYCRSMMGNRKLVENGHMPTFCGCLAKSATDDLTEAYKVAGMKVAYEIVISNGISRQGIERLIPESATSTTRTQVGRNILVSLKQCRSDAADETLRRRRAQG